MKHINRMIVPLLLVILFDLSLVSCSQSEMISKQENHTTAPASQKSLLEVSTEASNTVYPPGETLDLRLYETGEVEYDYYPPPNPSRVGEPFRAVRKRTKLSTEEVEHIQDILNKPDLSNAKAEYPPIKPILDSYIVKIVAYNDQGRERRIVLRENDSHLLLDKKEGVYPKSLIELLKLVQKINEDLRNNK